MKNIFLELKTKKYIFLNEIESKIWYLKYGVVIRKG